MILNEGKSEANALKRIRKMCRASGDRENILVTIERELRRLRRIVRSLKPEALLKPGRAISGSVKSAILDHAKTHPEFTVLDLLGSCLPNQSRDSLGSNLQYLARRGLLRKVKRGRSGRTGSLTTYSYRDRR